MSIRLQVNGSTHELDVDPATPLLTVLRNDLGLAGARFGCGLGQCGACTVLVDGEPVRSCVRSVGQTEGRSVTTLEGLGSREQPHPIQTAFLEEQALQCGYCGAGMLVSAAALLASTPRPSDAEIRRALSRNLCRCGAHTRILRAVRRAAREGRS